MKINVTKIPEGGIALNFERDGKWFTENLAGETPPDFEPGRIEVVCRASRVMETVFVEGSVSTTIDVPCCRCLEMTRLPIRSTFKYTFAPMPTQSPEEKELTADELDFAYYEGEIIDLDELVIEQIMLQIPFKPLCAEDCRGLCPHCGTNLNKTSCECKEEVFNERLAVLKKFKEKP